MTKVEKRAAYMAVRMAVMTVQRTAVWLDEQKAGEKVVHLALKKAVRRVWRWVDQRVPRWAAYLAFRSAEQKDGKTVVSSVGYLAA